jgi:biopolymer transport protein ExbB
MRSGLEKYKTVLYDASHDKETRLQAVKQELEEATALELPMLSKNLVILSTCASISTLLGLIGTVLGMIKSFSALATAGTPDATALSTGISEALINTALGITGSTVAIIMFNYFSTKIDGITHGIDEAGFSVSQTLANHK